MGRRGFNPGPREGSACSSNTGLDRESKTTLSAFIPVPLSSSPGKEFFTRLESLWRCSFPAQMHSGFSKQAGWESSKISHGGGNYTLFPQKELMWLGRLLQGRGLLGTPPATSWVPACGFPEGVGWKKELGYCQGAPTRH